MKDRWAPLDSVITTDVEPLTLPNIVSGIGIARAAPNQPLLAAAADVVVEVVEEEMIESAVSFLQTDLSRLQQEDTLLQILFPSVSLQVRNYAAGTPPYIALQHLQAGLQYDFEQLDVTFPYAMRQIGRLDSQSVQVIEEGEYWLERYQQGNFNPPVLPNSTATDPFPVNEWLTFMNSAIGLSPGQPIHPVAIRQLQATGTLRNLCHWWAGLVAPPDAPLGTHLWRMPEAYVNGLRSYHRFILELRGSGQWQRGIPSYLQAYLDFRTAFLTEVQKLDAEAVLQAIIDFRYNQGNPKVQRQGLIKIAEELAFDQHPFLMLMGNLALEKDEHSFQQMLRQVYLPHTNFAALRKNKKTFLLMAFGGINGGWEQGLGPVSKSKGWHASIALSAGPALSIGTGKYAHTFLLQIVDLGAPFSFLVRDADEISSGQFPDRINLETTLSPGFGYFFGLKNAPLSLGANASLVNNARQVQGIDMDVVRINIGLYVDFPLMTIAQKRYLSTHK